MVVTVRPQLKTIGRRPGFDLEIGAAGVDNALVRVNGCDFSSVASDGLCIEQQTRLQPSRLNHQVQRCKADSNILWI